MPARVVINFHVDDARALAAHLDGLGVVWLVELEERENGLFGTLLDPDGNQATITIKLPTDQRPDIAHAAERITRTMPHHEQTPRPAGTQVLV